jgi:hypothetical protein
MESPATTVEKMNSPVVNLTARHALPVYEVQELPVERRLRPGKYLVERNGRQVEVERRIAA